MPGGPVHVVNSVCFSLFFAQKARMENKCSFSYFCLLLYTSEKAALSSQTSVTRMADWNVVKCSSPVRP